MKDFYGYCLIDINNEPLALDCNDIKEIIPNEDMTYIHMKDGTNHLIAIEPDILANVWANYQNSTNKPAQSDWLKLSGPQIKLINKLTGDHELVYFTDIESAGCKDDRGQEYLYDRTTIKLFDGTEYYLDIHAHFVIKVWKALTDNRVYYGIKSIDPFSKPLKLINHNDLELESYDDFIDFAKSFHDDHDEDGGYYLHLSMICGEQLAISRLN